LWKKVNPPFKAMCERMKNKTPKKLKKTLEK